MKKVTKKVKLLASPPSVPVLTAPKTPRLLPAGRGAVTSIGALILVLVTITSLAASVLFYLKTSQAISFTNFASDELQIADHRMSNLQSKMKTFEKTRQTAAGKIVSCAAEAVSGDKNGDAKLVCMTAGGDKKVLLNSIRATFGVKEGASAPIVNAFLASGGSVAYIISEISGSADTYHIWTYDLTTGVAANLAGQ